MSVHSLTPDTDPGGAPGAFDAFYRHHYVRVLILMQRHFPWCDAEDIAQETMARCYLHFERLQSGRDPWPWVASVARNIAIDAMRKDRRPASVDDLPETAACTPADATYDAALARERRRALDLALSRLRPADRQLIEDHDLDDFACTELAAMLDLSPNALRQKLFRARRRLALELRRTGGAFGVAGLALHERLARVARRANDLVAAAGSTSAAAFGAIAAASLATTVAAILGGATAAALPHAAMPVARVGHDRAGGDRTAALLQGDAPRAAAVARPAAPRRPIADVAPAPVTLTTAGDPVLRPDEESEQQLILDTPLGPVGVDQHNEHTPGLAQACAVSPVPCPDRPEPS